MLRQRYQTHITGHSIARRRLLRGAAAGVGTLWLAACGGDDKGTTDQTAGAPQGGGTAVAAGPTAGQPRTGGTLRISNVADLTPTSAPHVITAPNSILYSGVYDQLVAYDHQLKPRPRIATSWEWSPDFLQLTLKLRPTVKFHSGRPFTSEDAKWNLERIKEVSTGSQWRNYANLMKPETPDAHTLVVKYDAPTKASFDALATTQMADRETIDQVKDGRAIVGTGPFRFKEWAPGERYTFVRNPEFWGEGKPYLDGIEVKVRPDAQAALIDLESGSIDLMLGVPEQDARRLANDKKFGIMPSTGGGFWYCGCDVKVPALADKRVRQAFAWAMDRQRMVDTSLFGFGRPASIPWPRQSPVYDKALDETYSYDPQKARQLLQAAGYDTNQTLVYSVTTATPPTFGMTEVYQQDLAKLGVKIDFQKLDNAVFVPKLQQGQFGGAWMTSLGFMNLSPATFFQSAFPVRMPNASNFVSERYKALIDQSLRETDDTKVHAIITDLTKILLDEAFVIPATEIVTERSGAIMYRSTVKNPLYVSSYFIGWDDLWLEK